MVAMAGTFEVTVSELRTGASNLAEDSTDLSGAGGDATGAISAAGAGVPGGPLAGALATFGQTVGQRCADMAGAIAGAGTTLSANAGRYESDDAAAAGALNAQMTFAQQVAL